MKLKLVAILSFVSLQVFARPQPVYFDNACEEGTQITLGAVGDFLIHDPLQKKAQRLQTFQPIWRKWLNYTQGVDQMYGNLEVTTARGHGIDGKIVPDPGIVYDRYVHTSYPKFNAHPQLLTDIKNSGFDVVSTANNHALDRGVEGVGATINELDAIGLPFTGTRRTGEQREAAVIIESKGIRVAWLACTLVLNSRDNNKQVLHCSRDWAQIEGIIKALRLQTDAIIMTPHWGDEGSNTPKNDQVRYGRRMIEAGATAVLGAHPHALQPMERFVAKDGREGFIIYSMANFVSFQPEMEQKSTVMTFIGLTKKSNGVTVVNGVRYIPALMRNRTGNLMDVELLPMSQSQKDPLYEQAKAHIESLFPAENEMSFGDRVVTNPQCY